MSPTDAVMELLIVRERIKADYVIWQRVGPWWPKEISKTVSKYRLPIHRSS